METGNIQSSNLCSNLLSVTSHPHSTQPPDYKLIAKALARIGNAYQKKNETQEALKFFQKSLSEHRAADVVKKVQQIERALKDAETKAYINPDLAEEERGKGNQCFTKGEFPNAVKHYTEVWKNKADWPIVANFVGKCVTH